MRVIGKMYISYNSKSDEVIETLIQYLQEKKAFKIFDFTIFYYWKTIDKEEVPVFAWIQKNTMGSTDWKSKWFNLDVWIVN